MRTLARTLLTLAATTSLAASVLVASPAFARSDAPDGQFADPTSYAFAFAQTTDTQYLSRCAALAIMPAKRQRCQAIWNGMNQWIVDNAGPRKIAYAAHTGDVVDTYITTIAGLTAKPEFAAASQAQKILDDAGVPNGVLPGNHDNAYGADESLFNATFGPNRYVAASAKATQPYYLGPWKVGDNSNHADVFTAGGYKFLVVHLGYTVTDAEALWADGVIKAHPDHNVIVATHAYLKDGPAPSGLTAAPSADGAIVRARVVAPNKNVFMVISGHEDGVARNILRANGHDVLETMADYQTYSAGKDGTGHAGFIRLYQFDLKGKRLIVDTYSPSLNSHRSRDFDAKKRYDGTEDEFTFPLNLIEPVR